MLFCISKFRLVWRSKIFLFWVFLKCTGKRALFLCLVCNHSSVTLLCYYCKQNVYRIDNPQSSTYNMFNESESIQIIHQRCWTNNVKVYSNLKGTIQNHKTMMITKYIFIM